MTVDGGLVVNCSAQNYPNTSCLIPPTTATLDLSHNNIEKIEEQDFTEVKGLRKLYLQFNQISFIDHRAFEDNPELEYLDISNNYLLEGSVLPFKNLVALNYLDISNNIGDKIQLGPQVSLLKHLQVLKLGNPQIISLGKNIFQGLGSLHLKEFHLITGDLDEFTSLEFMVEFFKPLIEVSIVNASVFYIPYNGPWYIKTIWIWIRAKKAPDIDLGERNLEYHAFLSYSEQDSTWVMNNLLKQLESDDPPYRICIHERDFTPGKAIIANIIDCISKSYKTVFVLSKNFVQSEWCHYEFFLAQHRVFEERRDSLILLLLEPIPANSIPDRFCKLRKMMNKSTYLEWPPDEACQSMFWKRLKAVLNLEVKAPSLQGNPGK
ncbi:toll-like receptor 2 type-2 [Lepisosteus oculatus]|uniref:toll-like receptor 2 type-2 n=1 Tax=Lepisosteus oculatus TaxID=7918 RepID=UPI003721417D